jgi:hypothetical protein
MVRTSQGLLNLAEALRRHLARRELTMEDVDRRLAWTEGRLGGLLQEGLRIDQLREVLQAAGIDEQAFFAELYDLSPKPKAGGGAGEEIPYSSGLLSDEDAAEFPAANEVLGLFRMLVQEGLRENLRDGGSGSVTGGDFPEDRPPKGPRSRKRY